MFYIHKIFKLDFNPFRQRSLKFQSKVLIKREEFTRK
ncbi:hypothetical protein NIES4074_26790 [Cylindrospermum sp. NIES-4074]|nr:hypothetical protein NIES4074_26790 [Cylindrospermum sp. NIES-4074]